MGKTFWLTCSLILVAGCDPSDDRTANDSTPPSGDTSDSDQRPTDGSQASTDGFAMTAMDAGLSVDIGPMRLDRDAALTDANRTPADAVSETIDGTTRVEDAQMNRSDAGMENGSDGLDMAVASEDIGVTPDMMPVQALDSGAAGADGAVPIDASAILGGQDSDSPELLDVDAAAVLDVDASGPGLVGDMNVAPMVDAGLDGNAFPAGPFGRSRGDTMADLRFIDVENREYGLSDMRTEDGVRLIILISTAAWCPACRRSMGPLSAFAGEQRDRGVLTVVAMYQNANFEPARHLDAAAWQSDMNLEQVMVADPEPAMGPYFEPFGRNKVILVNAQTMEIVALAPAFTVPRLEGLVDDFWSENPR